MSSGQSGRTADAVIISCRSCRVKNRIPQSKISANPKCGRCGSLLDSASASGSGQPVTGRFDSSGNGSYHGSSPVSNQPLRTYKIGDQIAGRYQIQDIFGGEGKSSMGIVYMCYDLEHHRILALKTLQNRYFDSKRTADSFKKEALAWIHLGKHPYIVRAYWVREIEHHMFIACELIEPDAAGRNTVTDYLKGPLDLRQILLWSIQFCHGMEYAVSMGVTPHRDIKPDNMMIADDGTLKITDFGLVGLWAKTEQQEEIRKLMQKNHEDLTFLSTFNNRIVAGSPPWMAPEQFYGVAEAQSDMYSFGVVLFQMISNGNLPFKPRPGDTWRTAHKEYPVPPIPNNGKALADVINTCLQKRRDKRYENFGALRIDLEKIFRTEITRKTGEKPPAAPHVEDLREAELINKGMSLTNLGLIEEGIKNCREGIRLNAENAEAHYNLGNALSKKGLSAEAVRSYREAIRIDRDFAAAHFNLAVQLFRNGQTDEAITEYKEALRIDPEFAAAHLNLGVAYQKNGMADQAVRAYREAIKNDPQFSDAYYRLGNLLLAGNLLDEAIDAYQSALRFNPNNAYACNNLGTAFMKKGLADESINAYGRAIQHKPDHADAHFNLGLAFLRKEMRREALYAFEEFMKYSREGDSRAEKAKEIIGKLRRYT